LQLAQVPHELTKQPTATRSPTFTIIANLRHAADDLVAGKAWKDRHSPFIAGKVNVRMADPAELDGDLYIPLSRCAAFELKRGKGRFRR
jgi:hypothetical protein